MASLTKPATALSRMTTTPWLYSLRAKSVVWKTLLTQPPAWTVEQGVVHFQYQEPGKSGLHSIGRRAVNKKTWSQISFGPPKKS